MSKAVSPHANDAAERLSAELEGKLEQSKIDAIVAALKAPATTYTCAGTTICLLFYTYVSVAITGGKSFSGNAGGICAPPGGAGGGDVYTDDINRLYRDTVSFYVATAAVYLHVSFFDNNGILLGHAECGGAYPPGTGTGSGSWS